MTEGFFSWYTGKLIQSDCGWLYQFGTATYILADAGVPTESCYWNLSLGIGD